MVHNLNILFLSTRAPVPANTGHFQRTFNTIKQVSKFANIYFLGFYDKNVNKKFTNQIDSELSKYCTEVYVSFITEEHNKLLKLLSAGVWLLKPKPLFAYKYYKKNIKEKIREIYERNKIDLVHLDMLPLYEYVNNINKTPFVLTNHNVESLRLMRRASNENNKIMRHLLKVQANKLFDYEKMVMKSTSHCIVVSEDDKKYLKEFNPSCNFYVIPNGVDTKYYRPERNESDQRSEILWIGNMADPYNRQGIQYFVKEIFDSVVQQIPDILWTVVGKEPPDELISLQKQYPNNIQIIGYVDDVREYYNKANVLVVPLLSGSGTKLKVIEGLGMGMPIVTTSIGAEGIDVQPGRDIEIANSSYDFAKSVINLLQNKTKRDEIKINARRIATEKYDWNIIGELLKSAYIETIRDQ